MNGPRSHWKLAEYHPPRAPSLPTGEPTPAARDCHPCPALSADQRQTLLLLARSTIATAVRQQPPPVPNSTDFDAPLIQQRACFVTIEKDSHLRGCIGHLLPQKPLYKAVMDAARQAAFADPRFAPLQPDELDDITLEISLLSPILPLSHHSPAELLDQLEPFRHGVVLQFEDRTSTFLPQVWGQIPDKTAFLDRLALKGGWDPATWRDARTRVSIYEVECFHEPAVSH